MHLPILPSLQKIRIIRAWYHITHNDRQISTIDLAYTIECISLEEDVEHIILTMDSFLPNLKVVDHAGVEYPIMPKESVALLLKQKDNDETMKRLASQIKDGQGMLLWIRIPPDRPMRPREVRIIHLLHESRSINKDLQHLYVDTNLPFRVLLTLKKPDDYEFTKRWCIIPTADDVISKQWDQVPDSRMRYDSTPNSDTLVIKPGQKAVISYKLKPKPSAVAFPLSALWFLAAISTSLIILRLSGWAQFDDLLDRDMELALFIASLSMLIPRLISNVEIRHRYARLFWVPLGMAGLLLALAIIL